MKNLINKSNKGFTLIELLVVIGILSILVVGLMVAINPQDKIKQATDARAITEMGSLGRAMEAYATANGGFYADTLADLTTSGELKVLPSSATFTLVTTPATCSGTQTAPTCNSVVITAPLTASKYTSASQNFIRWESATAKQCNVATATTACP
jgi:prepilin-type N-terminal cleavage/methylation domain-containing protein